MILKELCDYYDIVAESGEGKISKPGYETSRKVTHVATISKEGELISIKGFKTQEGKIDKKKFIIPKCMKIRGVAASPVLDKFEYIFGVGGKKGKEKIEKVKFEKAKELHLKLFSKGKREKAIAIVNFFKKWDINKAWENEHIISAYSENSSEFFGNIIFKLLGENGYFHDDNEIEEFWIEENERKNAAKKIDVRQCSIIGEILPIEDLHPEFEGIKGAQASGASLVCFNKDSDMSYNMKQSFNSGVSKDAVFKYSTALRYLLDSSRQKIYIGDDTTVFWASSEKSEYVDLFSSIFNPPDENEKDDNKKIIDRETEEKIKSILEDSRDGRLQDTDLDPNVKFCVLGLSPNAGRISVRYFYRNTFRDFLKLINRHYEDMKIEGKYKKISTRSLLYATISSKSTDKKVNPLLGGAVVRAILTGNMYPQILLSQIILRCKTEALITQTRAAAIKGFLIRKNRFMNKEEEISMGLNENSKNTAYVLGRTFAILEKIQKDALGDINSTIKDKYFSSACANPAMVFPNLLKLAQHHIAKLDGIYLNIQLGECLSLIDGESFPKTLNMENQGKFILGYYQQNQKLYTKKEKDAKGEN